MRCKIYSLKERQEIIRKKRLAKVIKELLSYEVIPEKIEYLKQELMKCENKDDCNINKNRLYYALIEQKRRR